MIIIGGGKLTIIRNTTMSYDKYSLTLVNSLHISIGCHYNHLLTKCIINELRAFSFSFLFLVIGNLTWNVLFILLINTLLPLMTSYPSKRIIDLFKVTHPGHPSLPVFLHECSIFLSNHLLTDTKDYSRWQVPLSLFLFKSAFTKNLLHFKYFLASTKKLSLKI